uniref:Uncharacterized protein n=1 Tax=Ditylenchus dipsaci TaxID=166011 RepID=A0A915EN85_9BILA
MPDWWKQTLHGWDLVADKNDASQRTFVLLFLTALLAAYTHVLRKMADNEYKLLKTERSHPLNVDCSIANVQMAKSEQSLNDVV